ncbi:Prenyltransferase and squalene oxidase repeat [Musa troglodytarum]|uniref:Terpene cyclase/mutase family member n=2 Tax=Musa troglodytarum TaxID=320322 RepID=A0A9E7GHX1_9LILI|nr:Prenyltransferase and squalene oxidase repeat [Musa troglodytarum]
MWRLKIAEGSGPWLRTNNNHIGRQVWEFDPSLGTPEEIAEVERAREEFRKNRFEKKHSSDLLMRLQFSKENPLEMDFPIIKLQDHEDVTEEAVLTSLRRAISRISTLQAHDGHWPGDYGGPMFLLPGLNKDGGWGLHIEGTSTMFGTALTYVMLRLLGEGSDGGFGAMEKGRNWILDHGSATAITSWGKMWLSVLGVFDWSGNNPLPPEMWLLPYFIPVHPGRMWCHCRMEDLYYPHPLIQDILWASLHKIVEPILMHWPGNKLREKAINTAMQHIHYEDENTRYICIGPVNKVLNMLCCWIEEPNSEAFKLHLPRVSDYLWVAEDGMKMQGYNGSQLWDTAFTVQAIVSTNLSEEFGPTLKKAHEFVKNSQVLDDCPGDLNSWYRHISKGAWPFSTADHGWPISDCTAEGLKAALLLSKISPEIVGNQIDGRKLYDAVNVILSLMNQDGGFATYELTRSYAWLEIINPAETFGDIVIDYPYVECTSAAIQALTSFKKLYPGHQREEIDTCITKSARFIEKIQQADGMDLGVFASPMGLVAAGRTYESSSCIRKACNFLLSKQLASGGWGESYLSCQDKVYTNLEGNRTHAVNTGWAMLALIDAGQEIMGVFNRNCMISAEEDFRKAQGKANAISSLRLCSPPALVVVFLQPKSPHKTPQSTLISSADLAPAFSILCAALCRLDCGVSEILGSFYGVFWDFLLIKMV